MKITKNWSKEQEKDQAASEFEYDTEEEAGSIGSFKRYFLRLVISFYRKN